MALGRIRVYAIGMRSGQTSFEVVAILATVGLLSGWGIFKLKDSRPADYASIQQQRADVSRDLRWMGARYIIDASMCVFSKPAAEPAVQPAALLFAESADEPAAKPAVQPAANAPRSIPGQRDMLRELSTNL